MDDKKKQFIDVILSKKELNMVDINFAINEFDAFLIRDAKAKKYFERGKINERSKEFKRIVKEVRSLLRRAHSLFGVGNRNEDYLRFYEELGEINTWNRLNELSQLILLSHASSSERIEGYTNLYAWLKKKIKVMNSIIDLGCGLHPLSIIFLGKKKLSGMNYFAFDINNSEKDLLHLFFEKLSSMCPGFYGQAEIMNLRATTATTKLTSLDNMDLAFMLKLTDHLDRGQGHKMTEKILTSVKAKFVLLSFPTITRSGNPMRYPKRKWVEYLCERLGYSFENFETKNELFYLVKKY